MEVFFEYEDDEKDKYYYSMKTQETTYEFPYNGKIFNPITKELIYKPSKSILNTSPSGGDLNDDDNGDSKKKKHHKHHHHQKEKESHKTPSKAQSSYSFVHNDSLLEITPAVKQQMKAQEAPPIPQRTTINVERTLDTSSFLEGISKFKTPEYAQKFFKRHRVTGFFSRREVPVGELISFSNKPLKEPLLSCLPNNCKKLAVTSFDYILQFTGVAKSRAPAAAAQKLVSLISMNPQIRDESYFQLIKQTTNCPDDATLKLGWELFLIIATIFPSSRDSENYILAHMAKTVKERKDEIGEIAHFTYIRFEGRCCLGTEFSVNLTQINKIPSEMQGQRHFGCTLPEIMWGQNKQYPNLPIPYVLHIMITEIISKNGYETEGLFRLPGNLKRVKEVAAEQANDSLDCIKQLTVHDIASLLKQWFRDLPNPVVPYSLTDELRKADEDNTILEFVEKLQDTHKYTLMYLIGFLKECSTHSDLTLMYDKNLAIVFGPNIVQVNSNEPGRIQLFSKIANDFVLFLIQNWDTSKIYPLDPSYLQS